MKKSKKPVEHGNTDKIEGGQDGLSLSERTLMEHHGMDGLLRLGLNAAHERVVKNRIILALSILCMILGVATFGLSVRKIEPRILAETADGRIRPLPSLYEPIHSQNAILAWADKCVRSIYDLNYVDWREKVYNETQCLSDRARKGFVESLRGVGVLEHLDPAVQGIVYAVPGKAVVRAALADGQRYAQWIVDIPYTLHVDGRKPGRLSAVMSMKIVRVPISVRDDGIWVDSYQVSAARK